MTQGAQLELAVERMTYGPDAIAHTDDGLAVFVEGAVAGDRVLATVDKVTDRWAHARTTQVVEAGPDRVAPACPYVGACGGCPWGALSYPAQARAKRDSVVGAIARIGLMGHDEAEALVAPVESPSDPWGYRNKVELAVVRDRGRLSCGMHATRGGVVRVDGCALLDARFAKAVKSVSGALNYLMGHGGAELERVGIRASRRTKDVEVALWDRPGPFPRAQAAKVLEDACRPTSVVRVLQKGQGKARKIAGVECLSGAGSWGELVGDERMRVSAPSFFQPRPAARRGGHGPVLWRGHLHPPTGEKGRVRLGRGVLRPGRARPQAQPRRRRHRQRRPDWRRRGPRVPGHRRRRHRRGPPARRARARRGGPARRAAYVSCDPATLARDLRRFVDEGTFVPVSATPVDLFPQTFHVETVTILRRARA